MAIPFVDACSATGRATGHGRPSGRIRHGLVARVSDPHARACGAAAAGAAERWSSPHDDRRRAPAGAAAGGRRTRRAEDLGDGRDRRHVGTAGAGVGRVAAGTDPLTGLLGARAFDDALSAELERARAGGRSLALAIADVDSARTRGVVRPRRARPGACGWSRATSRSGSAASTSPPTSATASSPCCCRAPTHAARCWSPRECAAPRTEASPASVRVRRSASAWRAPRPRHRRRQPRRRRPPGPGCRQGARPRPQRPVQQRG